MKVPAPEPYEAKSTMITVDGMETHVLEVGSGPPLVLLHSGEFGACAELSWEYNFAALGRHFRVIAPDWLGFGLSAKVHDFTDFAAFRLRHIGRLCEELGLSGAPFIGNSMAANFLLRDAASEAPRIPAGRIVAISGGGPVPANEARAALVEYDGTIGSMKRLLRALLHDEVWSTDEGYVARRHELSMMPGAWECTAAARFRNPTASTTASDRVRSHDAALEKIAIPALLMAGAQDKLKPRGYAAGLAARIPRGEAVEVEGCGHCPHLEAPDVVNGILLDFAQDRR